jgi:ABC-type branched-subunit amino acid transport system substrate-binding protein
MRGTVLPRRDFVRTAARGCALLLAGGFDARIWTRAHAQDVLRVGLIAPASDRDSSAVRGVTLGIEEAARTGALVGRGIELRTGDAGTADGDAAGAAERLLREGRVAALIGGFDDDSARALSGLADRAGILFLNVGSRADALRGAECGRNVFHVEASDAMYAAALAARGDASSEATRAALWHPTLERFGAAQLNDRFRARFGAGMDGAAWAGWMAVKALWEASLRARTVEAAGLRAYFERDATQLDGHKGWALSFRPWDHQLRQPLYLIVEPARSAESGSTESTRSTGSAESTRSVGSVGSVGSAGSRSAEGGTRVVGEVPARRGEEGSSREALDRLGGGASASACTMPREGDR